METSKYKPGEFGYWWTVIVGNDDIEGKVHNDSIDCSCEHLTSLKGCPRRVGGMLFNCSCNKLTSLEYCPEEIKGRFNCSENKLTSLEGGPKKVGGAFNCSENNLTSLKGSPREIGDDFVCSKNKLTTLEGCPEKVNGDFDCRYNELKSLEDAPKEIGGKFICRKNTNQTICIIAARCDEDDNEWCIIQATYKTLKTAEKNWKKELKSFFKSSPGYGAFLTLVKCKLSEEQFDELQYHIEQCDYDHLYKHNDFFTDFIRKISYDHGEIIHWVEEDEVIEINKRAEDSGEDPDDSEVFTKYFDQYFEQNF